MSIIARARFAGFLRGLFGRAENRAPARLAASAAPALAPAPTSAPPALPMPANATTPPAASPDEIELPLAPVIASLPLELRAKLLAAPPVSQTIRLQAEMVISQLAFGAVKISFGELRQLAPGSFVNSAGELDHKLVNLPLQEILPRVNSALLARRATKKVEVVAEIAGPFADRGRGFTFTTKPLKAPTAAVAAPTPEPEPLDPWSPPVTNRQVPPPPTASQLPPRSTTPASLDDDATATGHSHPLPVQPGWSRSVALAANRGPRATDPGESHRQGDGNGNGVLLPPGLRLGPWNGDRQANAPTLRKMPTVPTPAATPMSPPAAPQSVQAPPAILVALGHLCDHWPEDLQSEILRSPLAQAKVALDGADLLPGLKRGRVVLPWKQLRLLAQPDSLPSPYDHLELELPLKVIAPLFLAAQNNPARPRAKAPVSTAIPDLFFGFPQPAPAPVAPVAPPPKPPDTNYYVWGESGEAPLVDEAASRRSPAVQTDFLNRLAHPKEVVARAAALPGVAGAVVAMQDGLRVASQVPVELNADTLAAFLPQIFERVNQCTRELRMGALNNVNFTVGRVPWKVFRVNAVYFAAFGRAGETLPSAQLAQLAADLDRRK